MNLIHLIDTVDKVNFGIWNAALCNSSSLKQLGIRSFALFPEDKEFIYTDVECVAFETISKTFLEEFIGENNLKTTNTIIVSHGCWRWASKWGFYLKNKGFKWVYVPHGMLEPWSLQQSALKKKAYWFLQESKYFHSADIIRAVGSPEYRNLLQRFPKTNVQLVYNSVERLDFEPKNWKATPLTFLFMARLHHKKGILPLVQAWKESKLQNNPNYQLKIAGPDDGELERIEKEITSSNNIKYIGAQYGKEKENCLKEAHFYLLPSFSEGFPVSVLEALNYGCINLITEGCNIPEAFEQKVALKIETNVSSITTQLNKIIAFSEEEMYQWSSNSHKFVDMHFTDEIIAQNRYDLYASLLKNQ